MYITILDYEHHTITHSFIQAHVAHGLVASTVKLIFISWIK